MKKQSTALRLFRQLHGQRVRLTVICISIIIYVGLEVWTPMYSALVIDQLWQSIKTGWENEITFRITWDNMGRELLTVGNTVLLYVAVLFPPIVPDGECCGYAGDEFTKAGRSKAESASPALF